MSYKHGYSLCVSSQVGCAMGCAFCASTLGGKVRNLGAGEILDQIYLVKKEKVGYHSCLGSAALIITTILTFIGNSQ